VLSYWQLNPDFQLCWKKWDEQLVLYHTGSGDTHLFDQFGNHILQLLKSRTMTISELRKQLLADTNQTENIEAETTENSLDEFLNELQRLGIAEQVNV